MSRIYVAYGSNLNIKQMKERCPDAVFIGTGSLENWELVFRSGTRDYGVASIRRKRGCSVPVGLWSVSEADEESLDQYEGYPWLYQKQDVFIRMDPDGRKKKGMVYIMAPRCWIPAYPGHSYRETILQGYIDCGFNPDVLEEALEKCTIEIRKERP